MSGHTLWGSAALNVSYKIDSFFMEYFEIGTAYITDIKSSLGLHIADLKLGILIYSFIRAYSIILVYSSFIFIFYLK